MAIPGKNYLNNFLGETMQDPIFDAFTRIQQKDLELRELKTSYKQIF